MAEACNTEKCLAYGKRCPGSNSVIASGDNPLWLPTIECSGQGTCERSPSDCREGDDCTAVCVCNERGDGEYWTGPDCSKTEEELQEARGIRGEMLSSMMSAWEATEVSSDAAAQQISALASLSITSPDELSAEDKVNTLAFAASLAAVVDPDDSNSVARLLGALGSLSSQAMLDAQAAIAARGATSRRRVLSSSLRNSSQLMLDEARQRVLEDETATAAQQVVSATVDALNSLATALLSDFTEGQEPLLLQVRLCLQVALSSQLV